MVLWSSYGHGLCKIGTASLCAAVEEAFAGAVHTKYRSQIVVYIGYIADNDVATTSSREYASCTRRWQTRRFACLRDTDESFEGR